MSGSPSRTLLLATTNPGKIREIIRILEGVPATFATLADQGSIPEPDETGATFAENARLKALYYAARTGLPAVAEDSGLEIAALDNAPGVHSARWHGRDYAAKFAAIYRELKQRGLSGSPARFVAHVALARGGRILFEATGTVVGEIAPTPRGANGFGYDPIFFYPPYGRTLGEVDDDRKTRVSHRGKAFRQLRERLLAEPDLLIG
ncbi:MAG TPA: RdgB/HAM1 family non-canonical purine NTP pyrophosphatase [Vicinamibacterales bacterium]